MSPLTLYLGRSIGVGLLLMCGALALRPKSSLATIQSMVAEPGLLLVTGIVTMAAGVAMVVGHNLWSGGAVTIAVTAVGWLSLIKGLAIVAAPPPALAAFYRIVATPLRFRLVMLAAFVFSAWLAWAAFQATLGV